MRWPAMLIFLVLASGAWAQSGFLPIREVDRDTKIVELPGIAIRVEFRKINLPVAPPDLIDAALVVDYPYKVFEIGRAHV